RSRELSGAVRLGDDGEDEAAIQQAREHPGHYITAGRNGDFTVHPKKPDQGKCSHYCEFSQFCRVSITSRYKRET
ncbi:MAG: hypothetical protein K8I60_11585, partial [Anaerolineae bacterium]|nr:hypothetical protein [Anaerolineae bacterium]